MLHHNNVALLTVHPGSVAGEEAVIGVGPPASGVRVVNRVETVLLDGETELVLTWMPDGALEVLGTVPASAAPVYRTAAVQNPTVFFVRGLKQTLKTWGIDVSGDAVDLDEVDAEVVDDGLRVLASHRSPPLSDIAGTLMGVSQNLYAETLLRTLDQDHRPRTAEAGRDVMREVLESWGVDPSRVIVADGSGLSRYNYVTARTLVDVLQRMHDGPASRLAVPGHPAGGRSQRHARNETDRDGRRWQGTREDRVDVERACAVGLRDERGRGDAGLRHTGQQLPWPSRTDLGGHRHVGRPPRVIHTIRQRSSHAHAKTLERLLLFVARCVAASS